MKSDNDSRPGRTLLVVALPLVMLVWPSGRCSAAFEGLLVDSRAEAMGDCWCASNFAAVSLAPVPPSTRALAFGMSYRRPFGLSDLEEKNAALTLPVSRLLGSLGFAERGGGLYRERSLSATISAAVPKASRREPARRAAGKRSGREAQKMDEAQEAAEAGSLVSVSLSVAAFEVSVEGWKPARRACLSLGTRVSPVESADVCVGLGNVVSSGTDLGLRQTLLVGLVLRPHQVIMLAAEMRRQPGEEPSFHFGAELEPFGGTYLRCGIRTEPLELTMGFGVALSGLGLDSASSFHTVLGRTDSFSASFSPRQK